MAVRRSARLKNLHLKDNLIDTSYPSQDITVLLDIVRPKAKSKLKEFERTSKKPRERKYTSKDGDDVLKPLAIEAMRFYNKKNGTEYELVEPGCITSVLLLTGYFYHIDFIAKKAGVADAPEEMFFAELTATNKDVFVELCKCMGPKT